ncbi:MAG: type I-E CRISPR-associated protein Cse2/CasB [Blautia sp.]|nr:type I-E CRISPR-associated protein Cse2/CasB [Blautia sp.]
MEQKIEAFMRAQLMFLAKDDKTLEQSSSKAHLAQLRRGIGKRPGELPELWGLFLKNLPEELMGKNGQPSYAEQAVYTALTLFALHQQGHSEPMNAEGEENRIGRAARKLVKSEEDEEDVRMKLSIVAKSDDMTELSYYLKTIVKLLGNSDIKLDYVNFAKDLYWFQFENHTDRIRLKWGQDFYYNVKTYDNGKEERYEE